MMEDTRRKEILRLQKEGCSQREIADQFGISRERVRKIIHHEPAAWGRPRKWKYPNIVRFCNENRISIAKIAEASGKCTETIRYYMIGRQDPTLPFMRVIAEMTGMTMDQAFETDEKKATCAATQMTKCENNTHKLTYTPISDLSMEEINDH